LDRVLSVEMLDEAFVLPRGFDTPQGVLEALADMREDRWSVEVLLETTPGEARGQLPKMGVSLQEAPEGVVMRSSTSDLAWMARVLAGLSFPFLVRKPPELRVSLRSLAAEIEALAERT
jgi:predicted DNA-binding transcriptional regulator YafY